MLHAAVGFILPLGGICVPCVYHLKARLQYGLKKGLTASLRLTILPLIVGKDNSLKVGNEMTQMSHIVYTGPYVCAVMRMNDFKMSSWTWRRVGGRAETRVFRTALRYNHLRRHYSIIRATATTLATARTIVNVAAKRRIQPMPFEIVSRSASKFLLFDLAMYRYGRLIRRQILVLYRYSRYLNRTCRQTLLF